MLLLAKTAIRKSESVENVNVIYNINRKNKQEQQQENNPAVPSILILQYLYYNIVL